MIYKPLMIKMTRIIFYLSFSILVICFERAVKADSKDWGKTTIAPTSTTGSKPDVNTKSMESTRTSAENPKSPIDNSKSIADDTTLTSSQEDEISSDLDLMNVMTICNESFRIETSFLLSLNESGSFPDETDKTPKCYLRCVLQTMKIASEDGVIDPNRAAVVFTGTRGETITDIEDMTKYCVQGRDETCKCEMAYNFLKCLFSMEVEKYNVSSK